MNFERGIYGYLGTKMHIYILKGSRKFGTIFRLTENIVIENLFHEKSGNILG